MSALLKTKTTVKIDSLENWYHPSKWTGDNSLGIWGESTQNLENLSFFSAREKCRKSYLSTQNVDFKKSSHCVTLLPKGCQPSVAFPICWALIAILTRHMLEHSFLSISMWIISDMPKECKHFHSDPGTCWRVFVCKAAIPSSNQHTNNHSSHPKNQTQIRSCQ